MNSEIHLNNADLKYWINEFPVLEKFESKSEKIQIPMRKSILKNIFGLKLLWKFICIKIQVIMLY